MEENQPTKQIEKTEEEKDIEWLRDKLQLADGEDVEEKEHEKYLKKIKKNNKRMLLIRFILDVSRTLRMSGINKKKTLDIEKEYLMKGKKNKRYAIRNEIQRLSSLEIITIHKVDDFGNKRRQSISFNPTKEAIEFYTIIEQRIRDSREKEESEKNADEQPQRNDEKRPEHGQNSDAGKQDAPRICDLPGNNNI